MALQPPWALASAIQFHDHFTDGRTLWMSVQLVARPLPKHKTTQTQNKHIHQTPMSCVGFKPTIPASEREKTVHALDRSATVTGLSPDYAALYPGRRSSSQGSFGSEYKLRVFELLIAEVMGQHTLHVYERRDW
jgi:hypothetical protein